MSFAQSLAKTLGPVPYSQTYVNELKWRRKRSSSGLAIDLLLTYAGVQDPQYPPASREEFLKLVEQIESAGKSRLYQCRALFYLFLDFSQHTETTTEAPNSSTTVAEYYASQIWFNQPEQALVKSLWFLDHGKAQDSLECLGEPWELEGADALHEYIVESLADQKIGAVANYLATRGSAKPSNDLLVRSLAFKGKYAEVLDVARSQQNMRYLKEIARAAIDNRETSLELAQLPCSPEEWLVIKEELEHIIRTASPSQAEEPNGTTILAKNIMLVRALHTGDSDTLAELRSHGASSDLLLQKFVVTPARP